MSLVTPCGNEPHDIEGRLFNTTGVEAQWFCLLQNEIPYYTTNNKGVLQGSPFSIRAHSNDSNASGSNQSNNKVHTHIHLLAKVFIKRQDTCIIKRQAPLTRLDSHGL